MKLRELYKNCIDNFTNSGIESAEAEARFLIKGALGISDTEFFLNPDMIISDSCLNEFRSALTRRISGEPLQYILGNWDFMDFNFIVGPGVLIPRPETELLCQKVISEIKNIEKPIIYDLCSGSGCVGISLKKMLPSAEVYLVEKSEEALSYLKKNVDKLCGENQPVIIHGDVLDYNSFSKYPQADIIVSNPPYIASDEIKTLQKEVSFEPEMALDGGDDGLVFYRYIIENWKNKLNCCGRFCFEIGEDQGVAVSNLLSENGFDSLVDIDYNNHDRIVTGRMK